ncbi:MAG: thioredoxin family protein [Firmicutes bacterium]|nr:thioredoxin family protein [Bacillota bacterium]
MAKLINLTEENFENEVVCDVPVVVDFYADWCEPCQAMMPTVHHLAEEYDGKIKFCKVNIQDQRKLAISNQVMTIPTFLFLKGGRQIDRHTGPLTDTEFEEKLKALL